MRHNTLLYRLALHPASNSTDVLGQAQTTRDQEKALFSHLIDTEVYMSRLQKDTNDIQARTYVVCARWYDRWRKYLEDVTAMSPGPVSNKDLVDECGRPRPGLKLEEHYICVGPGLWALIGEHYGWHCELERSGVNLYAQEYVGFKTSAHGKRELERRGLA